MIEPKKTTEETLAEVIKELNNAILALRTLIERDYPNRREIEASYVKKESSDARLRFMMVVILVATLLSFGATVGTMSSCFIVDNRPAACHFIPGFDDLEQRRQRNDELVERIEELDSQ